MKNMADTGLDKETWRKIFGVVLALAPNATVYLFGSRAKGSYHDRSDIDIAVDIGEKMKIASVGEIRDMLNASNIPYKFDVVDLYGIDERLRSIILKEGIKWVPQ